MSKNTNSNSGILIFASFVLLVTQLSPVSKVSLNRSISVMESFLTWMEPRRWLLWHVRFCYSGIEGLEFSVDKSSDFLWEHCIGVYFFTSLRTAQFFQIFQWDWTSWAAKIFLLMLSSQKGIVSSKELSKNISQIPHMNQYITQVPLAKKFNPNELSNYVPSSTKRRLVSST